MLNVSRDSTSGACTGNEAPPRTELRHRKKRKGYERVEQDREPRALG